MTAYSTQVLLADDLHKVYGTRAALRGLSFVLQAGRVLGFLGPNGAGKTTAIRILTTILEPTKGHFQVDGIGSDYPQRIRRRIGVLPESLGFARNISGLECLTYFGQLYGRSTAQAKARGLALLEEVGLSSRARSLIGSYSRGMRQRLGIARALVNDPAVLFLDEPTLGLDPQGQQELLALIGRIAHEREVGVILCSHALREIEEVCDEVIILSGGQVVAAGTVAEVIQQAQPNQRNLIQVRVPAGLVAKAQQLVEAIPGIGKVVATDPKAGRLQVELGEVPRTTSSDDPLKNQVLKVLLLEDIAVLGYETGGGRLQDVFLQLTGRAEA